MANMKERVRLGCAWIKIQPLILWVHIKNLYRKLLGISHDVDWSEP